VRLWRIRKNRDSPKAEKEYPRNDLDLSGPLEKGINPEAMREKNAFRVQEGKATGDLMQERDRGRITSNFSSKKTAGNRNLACIDRQKFLLGGRNKTTAHVGAWVLGAENR